MQQHHDTWQAILPLLISVCPFGLTMKEPVDVYFT